MLCVCLLPHSIVRTVGYSTHTICNSGATIRVIYPPEIAEQSLEGLRLVALCEFTDYHFKSPGDVKPGNIIAVTPRAVHFWVNLEREGFVPTS